MDDEINQNLKKIGPTYSTTGEKQAQIVSMIKRFEIKIKLPHMFGNKFTNLKFKCNIPVLFFFLVILVLKFLIGNSLVVSLLFLFMLFMMRFVIIFMTIFLLRLFIKML